MSRQSTAPGETPNNPALVIRDLNKSFGSAHVLKGVDLDIAAGRVCGLLGPNGAGKSTLIKILTDVYDYDSGTIDCASVDPRAVGTIRVIHQDLGLVDALTVRDNLLLGVPGHRRPGGLLDHREERAWARECLDNVGMDLDVDTPLVDLSLGEKSLVAVAKMLSQQADVLILDEVTAALTRRESEWLLNRMREIATGGAAVIVVSHRLHEIATYCDEVHLIRDGVVGYTGPAPDVEELHELLTAGDGHYDRADSTVAATALVELAAAETDGVGSVDLDIHAGEVVGLVGPLSSNLYRIGHMVAGYSPVTAGSVTISTRNGQPKGRVAFVPEDRKGAGIMPGLDVATNASISSLARFSRFGLINRPRERAAAGEMVTRLDVRPNRLDLAVESLSGGNQQKTLLSRAAMSAPDLYIFNEPTRGVDIATRRAIYRFIDHVRQQSCAVLVITIDVDDALAVSDRIGVVDAGRIFSLRPASELDAAQLLEEVS